MSFLRDITGRFVKGFKHSEEFKQRMSEAWSGKKNPKYGTHIRNSQGTEFKKGQHNSSKTEFKKGQHPWNKGIATSLEIKNKISKATKEAMKKVPYERLASWKNKKNPKHSEWLRKHFSKEGHPNWRGGLSFEPYGLSFDDGLQEEIRKRDNYRCQLCGVNQQNLVEALCVHHIDYNKQNNFAGNLISLCRSCNTKVNYNREYWTNYLKREIFWRLKNTVAS